MSLYACNTIHHQDCTRTPLLHAGDSKCSHPFFSLVTQTQFQVPQKSCFSSKQFHSCLFRKKGYAAASPLNYQVLCTVLYILWWELVSHLPGWLHCTANAKDMKGVCGSCFHTVSTAQGCWQSTCGEMWSSLLRDPRSPKQQEEQWEQHLLTCMVFMFLLHPLDFLRQAVHTKVSPLALKDLRW